MRGIVSFGLIFGWTYIRTGGLWPLLWLCAPFNVAIAASCDSGSDPSMIVQCGFAKPEDVQYVPSRSLVIVSEQGWKAPESGGRISSVTIDKHGGLAQKRQLWPASDNVSLAARKRTAAVLSGDPECKDPPSADAFSPHGIAALEDARSNNVRVAVVGHGAREAIELFDLIGAGDTAELEWRGCIPLPPNTAGNDVAIHPDGRLFVTNYIPTVHDFRAALAMRRGSRGENTGDVLEWSPVRGWRHLAGTEMAIPNGIVLRTSSAATGDITLYVAESGKWRIVEFTVKSNGSVERESEIAVDGSPDDLNWTNRGTLLAPIAKSDAVPQWHLEEIDPVARSSRTVFTAKEEVIHSVTSATDIGGGILFGSMTDDKIAMHRTSESEEKAK